MAKITRTFRLDQDLVYRFDKAAATAGVDKTAIVTAAIKKFVEAVEMKKFWNTDKLVIVSEIYAPIIGKAAVSYGEVNLNGTDLKVIQSALRDYKSQRKDEEGARYDIDNVFAVIDFENKVCSIEYKVFWIGGVVERKEIKFPIRWEENQGPLPDITEIKVFEDNKEEKKMKIMLSTNEIVERTLKTAIENDVEEFEYNDTTIINLKNLYQFVERYSKDGFTFEEVLKEVIKKAQESDGPSCFYELGSHETKSGYAESISFSVDSDYDEEEDKATYTLIF